MCSVPYFEVLVNKRTLHFRFVIISYFIFHWNGQVNLRNFETSSVHLWVYPLSNAFYFIVILTWSPIENVGVKVLPPNSGYKFLHTLYSFSLRFATIGVIFIYEWIVLLYWSKSKWSTSTNFLVLLAEKYLNIFA